MIKSLNPWVNWVAPTSDTGIFSRRPRHPDDLSRIIDTINLLQTELAPGDAAAPRSSASSRVGVGRKRSFDNFDNFDLMPKLLKNSVS